MDAPKICTAKPCILDALVIQLPSSSRKDNQRIVFEAISRIEAGDSEGLGRLMNEAQELFDKKVMPASEELVAPVLHSVLQDIEVKKWVYGAKGVGSQGDGTVQFLAKSEEDVKLLQDYLLKKRGMPSFTLTIKPGQTIKKAIIPLAGFGTRVYPTAKIVKNALCQCWIQMDF